MQRITESAKKQRKFIHASKRQEGHHAHKIQHNIHPLSTHSKSSTNVISMACQIDSIQKPNNREVFSSDQSTLRQTSLDLFVTVPKETLVLGNKGLTEPSALF
eukprot:c29602_g1_i1 orf=153-461(+)